VIDNGPDSCRADVAGGDQRSSSWKPAGVKWSYFMRNVDPGPGAYQETENRAGMERTNDVVFTNDGKTCFVVGHGEPYRLLDAYAVLFTTPKRLIWQVTYTGQ